MVWAKNYRTEARDDAWNHEKACGGAAFTLRPILGCTSSWTLCQVSYAPSHPSYKGETRAFHSSNLPWSLVQRLAQPSGCSCVHSSSIHSPPLSATCLHSNMPHSNFQSFHCSFIHAFIEYLLCTWHYSGPLEYNSELEPVPVHVKFTFQQALR